MNQFNKSDYRSVTVSHSKTGEQRTFYVNQDGSSVIVGSYRTVTGMFKRTRAPKVNRAGAADRMYTCLQFNVMSEGKQANDMLYVHQLVWAAWTNGGVMPARGEGMVIDHIDEDHTNNHSSNLQRITHWENLAKGYAHKTALKAAA